MRAASTKPALLLLAAGGIALAALGQSQTTRPLSGTLSWLAPFANDITDVYPHPKPVIAGMVLLAVGAAVFVAAAWRWVGRDQEGSDLAAPSRGFILRLPDDALPFVAWAAGVIPLVALILRLYDGRYSHWLVFVFFVTLGLFAVPFAARDLRALLLSRPRWNPWWLAEGAFLVAMIAMVIAINVHDLTNWRFSAEGDEYSYYVVASNIAHGKAFNLFSQYGVYGTVPVLSSAYQAIFLKLLGGDIFAWKLSMVVLVGGTLVIFYLLLRELFGWRPALYGTAVLAASHYLMAFTHLGFTNLDGMFPTVLALWLLTVGLRRDSSLALFASGAAAGLGFYTFFTGRAAIVIIALYLLTLGWRRLRPEKVLPIAVAFALVVTPIFTLHGTDVFDVMLQQSTVEQPEAAGGRVERFAHNIVPSVMAFSYNPLAARYISGSLLDPVSAVLFALGLGLAAGKVRHPAFRLLLLWWAVSVAVTGLANPRADIAPTRFHYVVPAGAALAGVAFDRALMPLIELARRPAARTALAAGALGLLLAPVLYLNLHRFWYETPRVDGTTWEAVVVRGVTSKECEDKRAAVITPFSKGLLSAVFDVYQLGDRTPLLLPYEDATSPLGPLADGEWKGCIIIDAQAEPPVVSDLVARLHALYPNKAQAVLTDLSGSFRQPIFY